MGRRSRRWIGVLLGCGEAGEVSLYYSLVRCISSASLQTGKTAAPALKVCMFKPSFDNTTNQPNSLEIT